MDLISQIKIIAAVLAGLLLAGLGLYIAWLRSELLTKRKQLEDSRREASGLALEIEANRRGLAEREAERERLAGEKAALAAKLEEVYQNDPEARTWGDNDCPDGVIDCLRK
jgi:hypothetical protein